MLELLVNLLIAAGIVGVSIFLLVTVPILIGLIVNIFRG